MISISPVQIIEAFYVACGTATHTLHTPTAFTHSTHPATSHTSPHRIMRPNSVH
jgi:hypothetical protein